MKSIFFKLVISLLLLSFGVVSLAQDCQFASTGNQFSQSSLCYPVTAVLENVHYGGLTYTGTDVQIYFDWGYDGPPEIVPAIYNPATNRWTVNYISHTYPDLEDYCNYEIRMMLVVGGDLCTSSVQAQRVTIWDKDNRNGAFMHVEPVVFPICYGDDGRVTFVDESQWNCVPPLEFDVMNSNRRWTQWIYGTGATSITNALVDGNAWAGVVSDNIQVTTQPIFAPQPPNNTAKEIYIPAGNAVGSFFEVTLRNWNFCNPYDNPNIIGPPVNADDGDYPPILTTAMALVVPYPDASVDPAGPFCETDDPFLLSPTFTAGGTWSGPGIVNTNSARFWPDVAGPGIHEVFYTVANQYGCSSSSKVVIEVKESPAITLADDEPVYLCPGLIKQLSVNITGGYEPYNVLWTGDVYPLDDVNIVNPVFESVVLGIYNLNVTVTDDQNCKSDLPIEIVISPVEVSFNPATIEVCSDEVITLSPLITGGSRVYVLHEWSGDNLDKLSAVDIENPEFSSSQDGTFSFNYKVTDDMGCSDESTITIVVKPTPSADAGANDGVCSLQYALQANSAAPALGEWSMVSGESVAVFDDETDSNSSVTVSQFGSYTFLWSLNLDECLDSDEVTITFNDDPSPQAIPDFSICGLEATIEAIPDAANGQWSVTSAPGIAVIDDVSIPQTSVTVDTPGTYSFTWTESSGALCDGEAVLNVTFLESAIASVDDVPQLECSPFEVTFNNTSSNASSYLWNLGAGATSTQPNPTFLYENLSPDIRTYNITLVAYHTNGCDDVVEFQLQIAPKPIARAMANPPAGCTPVNVSFNNISLGANQYLWNFDDLTETSDLPSPTHNFVNNEMFTKVFMVGLTATNTFGCSDETTLPITVYPQVNVLLNVSPDEGCTPLESVLTASAGYASYQWEIEGEVPFTAGYRISHSFENNSSEVLLRNVMVTAFDFFSCNASAQQSVTVHPFPLASFDVTPPLQYFPNTQVLIQNNTIGDFWSYEWNFGDAQSSTVREPVAHSFNASGIYTISLKVYNDFCSDITTEEITILPTLPEIVYGNSVAGCPPLNVEFSNLTTEATSFLWDFGDGNTSSLVTPSHTYSNSGVYTVTLTATGPGGTSVANNVQVTVHNVPVAAATASPSSGCSPLQVYFDNNSTGAVSYLWDFGDGSISSDVMSPTHVFYTGNYSAQLLVENTFGCTSSINIPVRVFPQWDVEILATPNQGCHPLQSLVVASAGGVMYNWDLGDGTIFTAGNSFSHRFNNNSLEIAEYNISVEAVNQNSCIARAQASIVVFPAPQAVFEAQPHSQQLPNRQVAFVNHTAGDLWDFEWDFGDGAASNDKNPFPHSYADAGEYTITLTASANDCSNSTSARVQILPVIPQIEFSNPQEGCPPLSVTFANNTFGANSFLWEFGDGMLSQDRSPTHVYHAPGVYNVRLTATGVGGISFSDDVFITVHTAPVALFEVVPKIISIPGPSPVFINRSIDAVSYLWDFGDGNGSTDFSPKHNYASAGVYTISLNATSADGCEHRYSIPEAIIVQLGGELKFPNAFTPSASGPSGGRYQYGDPQNHIFYPFTQEGVVEYQLQIFTRWGEIIFESSDIEIGWDGYHRGKLAPQGVYIWRARYKTAAGNEETRAGDVTLIR